MPRTNHVVITFFLSIQTAWDLICILSQVSFNLPTVTVKYSTTSAYRSSVESDVNFYYSPLKTRNNGMSSQYLSQFSTSILSVLMNPFWPEEKLNFNSLSTGKLYTVAHLSPNSWST